MSESGSGSGTILVVDDERDLADMYALQLSEKYDVETAYDGHSALDIIDEDVDVVLLDRRMPELSGDEVLDELEEEPYNPVIAMVTAVDPDLDVASMPIDDYLVKPISKAELLTTVDRLRSVDDYEELRRELSAKKVRRNVLEVEKSQSELEASDEFQMLTQRIEELEEQLDDLEEQEATQS